MEQIDLDMRASEIQVLVGLNGAGKTTLMRILLGMLRPDSGQVTLHTRGSIALSKVSPADWRRVGHLIEAPLAYGELTVAETIHTAARCTD